MKDLTYSIVKLTSRHREGSFGTQSARNYALVQAADTLDDLGFRRMKRPEQIKAKHVWALVTHWQDKGVSAATIKNRMAHIRWMAAKVGNADIVANSNDHYGISKRNYISNIDKALKFTPEQINQIKDPHVKLSAELQKAFGLRREEAMKLMPSVADKKTHIELKGSWTKGGKPRTVPIRNETQRELLDRCHALVGKGSLIPSEKSYYQHVKTFEKSMHSVGLGRSHGARHQYAQERYKEMTGWDAPAIGGPSRKSLSVDARKLDDQVRLAISREMGHERIQIVGVYLGT